MTIPNAKTTRPSAATEDGLSRPELHQLTLFKWRYSFEGMGFNPFQAQELTFLTWLHCTRRVPS